jgi:hypothetical protein
MAKVRRVHVKSKGSDQELPAAASARHVVKVTRSKGGSRVAGATPRAVSAAEEAARTASPRALTDAEKAQLAAEVSRIEDA